MPSEILSIQPDEFTFPFELRKEIPCSVQLVNLTDNLVAFKVKTTSPKKYTVRPNASIISPRASIIVTVTLQEQIEAPTDMHCKDKFLIQSVVLPAGETEYKEVHQDMFDRCPGKEVFERKLKVVYVSRLQSPCFMSESQEDSYGQANDFVDWKEKIAEAQAQLARLTQEKKAAVERSQKLQAEIQSTKTRKDRGKGRMVYQLAERHTGFSFAFLLLVAVVGILVGYLSHS